VCDRNNHLVLRARPSGPLISPTAHNLHREYTVLSRLNAYNQYLSAHSSILGENEVEGWSVPVPRTYGYYPGDNKKSEDEKAIGMPEFYVMEFKEGKVFEDCEFPDLEGEGEKEEW
jgi:aminoglycoside phosphotransferase (APT) family kinase protein